jgi:hypothetical protein
MMGRCISIVTLGAALAAAVPVRALQEGAPPERREGRTAYVRRLYEQDRATYQDAGRMVLSLASGRHEGGDFETLRRGLLERGLIDPDWTLAPSDPVTKGTVAYMLCRALDIRGGLTMRIFGISRRYAFRECVYLGIFSGGTTDEYVSGRELIDVITNAEHYRERGTAIPSGR